MIEINPELLLAQGLTFLIAVFILWKFAWGPLLHALQDRRQQIQHDFALIQESRESVRKIHEEYDVKLARLERKTQEALDTALTEGRRQCDELIKQARTEADEIRRQAREQLEQDRTRLISELRGEVFSISMQVAETMIRESVGPELRQRMMAETLDQVDRLSGPGKARG